LAVTISGTLVVSSLVFYLSDVLSSPAVLKIAIAGLSFLIFLFFFWQSKMHGRASSERGGHGSVVESEYSYVDIVNRSKAEQQPRKDVDENEKLAKTLQSRETILQPMSSTSGLALEGLPMTTSYPSALVRAFALGASVAMVGLAATIVGTAIGNFPTQFGGAGLLALGLLAVTFAVLRAEHLDEQHS